MILSIDGERYEVLIHPSGKKFVAFKQNESDIVKIEQKMIKKIFGYDKVEFNSIDVLTVFYIPSWECNMNCAYCFEKSNDAYCNINKKPKEWALLLQEYAKKNKYNNIHVVFFGGEPSLFLPLCSDLYFYINKNIVNDCNIQYSIVTNGYEISEDFIKFCSKFNISNIQITLDCDKHFHDSLKKDNFGNPTFDKILTNVKRLLDNNLPITIRTNVNNQNIKYILILCNELIEIKEGKNIAWSIAPILSTTQRKELQFETGIFQYYMQEIYRLCKNNNITLVPWNSRCDFFGGSNIVFNTDGQIYNCCNLCKHKISLADIKYGKKKSLSCKLCFWYWLCDGGCKYQNFLNNGDFGDEFCNSKIFDSLLLPIIQCKLKEGICQKNDFVALEFEF